jgi:acyl-CoA reductase-like NAD-dependent aldehyde dehydrogenase
MVSELQRDQVRIQVDEAVKAGAKVLARGPVQSGVCAKGFFQEAVVLSDVTQDHAISHTETFGPVVAISSFDGTEASAIRLANDTAYGLAAYVYTGDLDKARRVAVGVQAGQVGINNYSLDKAPITCPWVGAKGSGFGHHSGVDGWQMFSVPKSLVFNSEGEVPGHIGGTPVVVLEGVGSAESVSSRVAVWGGGGGAGSSAAALAAVGVGLLAVGIVLGWAVGRGR